MCGVKESVRIDSVRISIKHTTHIAMGCWHPSGLHERSARAVHPLTKKPGLVLHEIAKPIAHKVILCSDMHDENPITGRHWPPSIDPLIVIRLNGGFESDTLLELALVEVFHECHASPLTSR